MTKIYTLTLAPRWIAPRKPHRSTRKANFAAARRYLNRRRRDQRGPRRDLSRRQSHRHFPVGGATGEHLAALLADEQVPVETVETRDWTRQNLHVHVRQRRTVSLRYARRGTDGR